MWKVAKIATLPGPIAAISPDSPPRQTAPPIQKAKAASAIAQKNSDIRRKRKGGALCSLIMILGSGYVVLAQ